MVESDGMMIVCLGGNVFVFGFDVCYFVFMGLVVIDVG